jgi:hypothetical protein
MSSLTQCHSEHDSVGQLLDLCLRNRLTGTNLKEFQANVSFIIVCLCNEVSRYFCDLILINVSEVNSTLSFMI